MARCWPLLILLTSISTTLVDGATTLPSELKSLVPQCAQPCFTSFIDSNYAASACGQTPDLDCLCSHDSASEYTIGEASVQCIVGAQRTGVCSQADTKEDVVLKAHGMCNGKANAIPNTHTVISATLEVQSNTVRLQPPSTTLSNSITATSTLAVTSIPTSSSSSSGFLTSTGVVPAPATTQPPAESQTTVPVLPPTETPKLTQAQIVGITVAAVGGMAVMLGIIGILACVKRRQRMEYDDGDDLPLSMDPSYYPPSFDSQNSYAKPLNYGPGGTTSGVARKVAPPVPRRFDVASPNMFSRRSMQADEIIGLAISPELNQSPVMRRPRGESKLLPPKPTLRLQMPPKAAAKFAKTAPKPMTYNRESTMTTFDEDFERPGWVPQVPPTPKFIPASLQGAGLSFPPPVAGRPGLRRESTATLFEDVEESGLRKSQVGNARGVSYIQPSVIVPMPVPQDSESPLELDGAPRDSNWARQSTATQFEEDAVGNMSIGPVKGKADRRSRVEQDLDNTIDEWERYTPINTTGPPAFYFTAADVQGSEAMRMPLSQAKPVMVGRRMGSFSQPRNPMQYPPRKDSMEPVLEAFPKPPRQMVPLQLKIPITDSRPPTVASSNYATPSSSNPANSPTPSLPPTGSLPQIPKAYRQTGPYDSHKAGNSVETNSAASPAGGPRTGELQLSPVFESPASGRSRVSYPKIPKPQGAIKAIPPPPQPNFTPNNASEARKPWEAAEAAAREKERRIQVRRQSSLTCPPQGIMIHLPPTQIKNKRLSTVANLDNNPPPHSPNWDTYTPTPISPSGPSFSSTNRTPHPPALSSPFTSPRPKHTPKTKQQVHSPTPTTPGIRLSNASTSTPPTSPQPKPLAHRRGNNKASALTLTNRPTQPTAWAPLKNTNLLSPDSRRVVGEGGVAFERADPIELPGTPGWVPKLTPTRKGEDLYLRVA
ncbi:hypothetical protein GLAREA_03182 [Glarea lozoyensis ATCC 20868]|uniref:Extracellular membrane protein CFEM domain-containing protein n=1 Tax=Glarea lozoyensis (strain ATCC 20868 / MF5171) TaxID=1116229 RepID=S3CLA0_GLAL2|nr:uncharacterized protein GLAREA_03182 [Glarea lozoyensis ATCC 20868]EPE27267.1 hypothetical protein GLAREA_03182 [Glarea lozoyensis ATCC 20868]